MVGFLLKRVPATIFFNKIFRAMYWRQILRLDSIDRPYNDSLTHTIIIIIFLWKPQLLNCIFRQWVTMHAYKISKNAIDIYHIHDTCFFFAELKKSQTCYTVCMLRIIKIYSPESLARILWSGHLYNFFMEDVCAWRIQDVGTLRLFSLMCRKKNVIFCMHWIW